jgi:hypothetical protein
MPRHKQVDTPRPSGGPVCAVCGAYEGALTSDCPGTKVELARQQEIYETNLDYTEERGWHLKESTAPRSPLFECKNEPPEPPTPDLRALAAPSIDWVTVDRHAALQHELSQRAVAWVLADRTCEDHSAALTLAENEGADPRQSKGTPVDLESKKISFRRADQQAQRCDEEFRQAARRLVTALEESPRGPSIEASRIGCGRP